jgi:hypothetical protein
VSDGGERWYLQAHQEAVDTRLEHELKEVTSREAGLDSCETALVEERKKLEETRLMVSDRELAANIRHSRLDTREVELADRERRLAEAHL